MASAIGELRERGNSKGADVSEHVATIMAMHDLYEEAEAGRLSPHQHRLKAAIELLPQ